MRRAVVLIALAAAVPAVAVAQSSQFGVRGMGLPGRALSARSFATGGAFALFDQESAWNPATVALLPVLTTSFTGTQNWRNSENPGGSATARDNRFPQIFAGGPLRGTRFGVSVSVGAYSDRSFALASEDTVAPRGVSIAVFDTLTSKGGLSDSRVAGSFLISPSLSVGLGLHLVSGSARIEARRTFEDTSYAIAVSQSDLSFAGFGVSAGFHASVAPQFRLAGMIRTDTKLNVDRDTTRTGSVELPLTIAGGFLFAPSNKLAIAGQGRWRNWSVASEDLQDQGGVGSRDSYEISGGIEYVPDPRRPFRRPLRLGARYGTLPFPLVTGQEPHEFAVSAGTGFRFTGGRGAVDVALERVWRSAGTEFTERAFLLTVGISIRP